MSQESVVVEKPDASVRVAKEDPPKRNKLANRGFISLLMVSFFGAANDNILKQVLILMVAGGGL